jgi:RNA polymerase sigma-70 factor (ECF subfamily)
VRGIASRVLLARRREAARSLSFCDEQTLDYLSQRFETLHRQPGSTFDEKVDALRHCVHELPERYRELIALQYEEDIQIAGLVQRLGLETETVKKRLQRAKARLLDCNSRKMAAVEV